MHRPRSASRVFLRLPLAAHAGPRENGRQSAVQSRAGTSVQIDTMKFKRNQVEEAIVSVLGAQDSRIDELQLRIRRLLAADRKMGRHPKSKEDENRRYAFFSNKPAGSGVEVMFSSYEAFAVLAAVVLLEHGWPQASVVRILRQVRSRLEPAHAATLQRDPQYLFDENAVMAQARAGEIAADNTHPVFLVIAKLRPSIRGAEDQSATAICFNHNEVSAFIKLRAMPGFGVSFFEFVRLMHNLAQSLLTTRPAKRGRPASDT